jgi:hypothetical protein
MRFQGMKCKGNKANAKPPVQHTMASEADCYVADAFKKLSRSTYVKMLLILRDLQTFDLRSISVRMLAYVLIFVGPPWP